MQWMLVALFVRKFWTLWALWRANVEQLGFSRSLDVLRNSFLNSYSVERKKHHAIISAFSWTEVKNWPVCYTVIISAYFCTQMHSWVHQCRTHVVVCKRTDSASSLLLFFFWFFLPLVWLEMQDKRAKSWKKSRDCTKEQEKLNSVPICVYGAIAINVVMEHSPVFSKRETHTYCEVSCTWHPFVLQTKKSHFSMNNLAVWYTTGHWGTQRL